MGGSSSPTVKDSLTSGQEHVDQLLFRNFLGLPQTQMPDELAAQLGLPKGSPYPWQNLFNGNPQQYNPGGVVPGAGKPGIGLPGATPYLTAGPPSNDPNLPSPQPPTSVFKNVNAPINQTLQQANQWANTLTPGWGLAQNQAAIAPALAGQKVMDFQNLKGPGQLNLPNLQALQNLVLPKANAGPNVNIPKINTPGALNLPTAQSGPQLNLGRINTPGPLNLGNVQAAPNLNLAKINTPAALNMGQVSTAPKVAATMVNPDMSYKYDPFHAQDISGGTGQATDKYNYKPGSVASTLDNAKFTQDYFQQGVMAPLLRQYDTAIKPRLADTMSAAGGTFSTRAQTGQQMALQDLNTQATAALSSAVRQDQIEKSQQDLAAQQFNVGTATQNAQFGGQLQSGYDMANMQRALQIAQMNQQGQEFQHQENTAGAFNQSQYLNNLLMSANQQNNQNTFQAAGINNQAQQFAQNLNSQNTLQQYGLNSQNALNFGQLNSSNAINQQQINNQALQYAQGLNSSQALQQYGLNSQNALNFGQLNSSNAINQQQINNQDRQFAQNLNSQQGLAQYGLNSQNALNFGQLNSQNTLQGAQLNNQNNQYYANLNQQGALGAFNANVQNQLGFGGLNTQRALGAADLNSRNQLSYDTLNTNTNMALGQDAANRQMQAIGVNQDMYDNQFNRVAQLSQMGMGQQQLAQDQQNRDFQEFLRTSPENNPWLQMLMNYRGIPTNQLAFQNPSTLQNIMGGVGAGAAGLQGLSYLPKIAPVAAGAASGIGNAVGAGLGGLGGLLGLLAMFA